MIKLFVYNGKIVFARFLAKGSYSKVFESNGYVYTLTRNDPTKRVLAQLDHPNLPKIEYIGKRKRRGEVYTMYRMPKYNPISDNLYKTYSRSDNYLHCCIRQLIELKAFEMNQEWYVYSDAALRNMAQDNEGNVIFLDAFSVNGNDLEE